MAAQPAEHASNEPSGSTLGASDSPPPETTGFPPAAELDLGGQTRMANLRAAMFGVRVEPARVDRFVLLEALGAGGMGVVHAAYDPRLDRRVALKLVHPEVAAVNAGGDGRLVREAQAMAKLSHPNVVQIHEVGVWEGRIFIAMELVAGRTLTAWCAEKRRSWREVVAVFVEAGKGLAAAHAAGVVHRDFKPDNVLIGDDGRVRVTDFGLARGSVDAAADRDAWQGGADPLGALAGASHTVPGARAGTPAYMSPEQFLGEVATAASDQFSFCVALHHGLHGVHPFPGDDRAALMQAVVSGQRREPPRVLSPRGIHRAVVRGLAREPAARFAGMDALLAAISPRPRLHLVVPAVVLALVGGGSLALAAGGGGEAPCADAEPLLAGTWDLPTRAALHEAFTGSTIADASVLAASTEEGLDAYAAEVSRVYVQSCRAERSGESSAELHDLRVACLRRRLAVVRGVIERVVKGEPAALRQAPGAAANLRDLGVCEEEGEVLLGMSPPPPGQAEALARVRGWIDEARALELVGDLAGSGAAIDEVLPEARALGHEPTLAEALCQRGRLDVLARDAGASAAALREAHELAVRSRHDALIPEITVWGVYQAALGGEGTGVLARERLAAASAWTRRVGTTTAMQAALALAEGTVHELVGSYEDAAAASRRAIEIETQAFGEDHLKVALARGNLANQLAAAGHTEAALAEQRAALEALTRKVGGVHALVAGGHYNLATTLMGVGGAGALTEAERELQEAGRGFAALSAVPSIELADTHLALAQIAYLREEFDVAEQQAAVAQDILERHHPEHPERALVMSFRGSVAMQREQLDAARELHLQARPLYVRTNGEISHFVATTDHNLAEVLHAQGDRAGAWQYYKAALRTYAAVHGPSSVHARDSLVGLAELQLAAGEACAARDGLAIAARLAPEDRPADLEAKAAAACDATSRR